MRINGLKVVDAKRKLSLHISAADIRRGNNKDPGGCAAALALKREYGVHQARVHVSRIYVQQEKGGTWMRYKTPEVLAREIIAFDRGGNQAFEPGEYACAPMPASMRLGQGRLGSKDTTDRSKRRGKVARIHHTANIRPRGANR